MFWALIALNFKGIIRAGRLQDKTCARLGHYVEVFWLRERVRFAKNRFVPAMQSIEEPVCASNAINVAPVLCRQEPQDPYFFVIPQAPGSPVSTPQLKR
jgi:hypothetical protein